MALNTSTVDAFLNDLCQIIECIRRGSELSQVQRHAEHARICAELISIHPDFVRASRNNGHSVDPATAPETVLDTLVCIATAGLAQARLGD